MPKKKVKIEKDAKGRKFIKIGNKKLYIGQNISTKLLKTLLNIGYVQNLIINLNNRRKRRKAAGQSASLTPAEKAKLKDLEIKRAQLAEQVKIAQIKEEAKSAKKSVRKTKKVAPVQADASAQVSADSKSPPRLQEAPASSSSAVEEEKEKRRPYLKSALKRIWGDAHANNTDISKIIGDKNLTPEQKDEEANKYAAANNLPLIIFTGDKYEKVVPPDHGHHEEKEEKGNLGDFLADKSHNVEVKDVKVKNEPKDTNPPVPSGEGKVAKYENDSHRREDDEKGLYSDEIDKVMKYLRPKGYVGCIAKDEIKDLKVKHGKPCGFVVNLDTTKQKGSHWVAVNIVPNSAVEYFDSFGAYPSKDMEQNIWDLAWKVLTTNYPKWKVNTVKKQDAKSSNCGFFAMQFLIDRMDRGKSFIEATGYDDSKRGEERVERFKTMLRERFE